MIALNVHCHAFEFYLSAFLLPILFWAVHCFYCDYIMNTGL